MVRPLAVAGLALLQLAGAQDLPLVSGLPHPVVLRRIPAEEGWDLVVALSSNSPRVWTTKDHMGVLLQNRAAPGNLLPLAIVPGPNDDCSTRVERFTLQELVLSCEGEKWTTYNNQKLLYDVRAHKLTGHFSYAPFSAERVLPGPRFVMAAGERRLVVEIDPASGDLRITGEHAPGAPPVGATLPPLPQTDLKTWQRARPDEVKNYSHVEIAEIHEEIGAYQREGGQLWIGKSFYNGEGATGVGGFGYFDPAAKQYRLFSPPEIADWSVSAMLMEADCVWLALDHRGEFGNYPGGLLRWDRATGTVRHWDMSWIATKIARGSGAIYMGTTDGIAVLRGDRMVSYFVDRSAAGQYRLAERN